MDSLGAKFKRIFQPKKLKIKGELVLQCGLVQPSNELFLSPTAKSTVKYFLHVEVTRAIDLVDADLAGLSDSFVVLKLNGVEFGRTDVVPDNLNPRYFEEAYEIPIFRDLDNVMLTAEVWDMDTVVVGDFLGKVSVNVECIGLKKCSDENLVLKEIRLPLGDWQSSDVKSIPSKFRSTQTEMHKCPSVYKPPVEDVLTPKESTTSLLGSISGDKRPAAKSTLADLEVEDKKSSGFAIYMSIFMIFAYLFVTVIFYSWLVDDYSVREALYMAVATFTTVGYGDILPTNDNAKIFACFHAFSGILFIGAGVGILVSAFIKAELANAEAKDEERSQNMLAMMETDDEPNDTPTLESKDEKKEGKAYTPDLSTKSGRKEMKNIQSKASLFDQTKNQTFELTRNLKRGLLGKILSLWTIPILVLAIGAAAVGSLEEWKPLDSIYWVMITACSVGYGDLYPTKESAQWIAVFFIPISVGLMTGSISQSISYFFEHYASEEANKLFLHDFALDDLIHIKAKDTNKIERHEFFAFMLTMMKKVDQKLIDKLNAQFDQMDADGNGFLEPVDLEIITKNKRKLRRGAITRFHAAHSDFEKKVGKGEETTEKGQEKKFFGDEIDPETAEPFNAKGDNLRRFSTNL